MDDHAAVGQREVMRILENQSQLARSIIRITNSLILYAEYQLHDVDTQMILSISRNDLLLKVILLTG